MGNYCTSGQSKKNRDNASQKSEESATYQCSNKNKKSQKSGLKAPLADPEPVSDISNLNVNLPTTAGSGNTNNGNLAKTDASDTAKPAIKAIQGIHSTTYDSTSSSPLTVNAPCDLPVSTSNQPDLPSNLTLIYGKLTQSRRTENDKKIVLYVIAADDSHKIEKEVLSGLYNNVQEYCACRGFELQLCNTQEQNANLLDPSCWIKKPLEAQGGHHIAAKHLSEIERYSNLSYIIPVLFLGTSLGSPLLPLTIESQDFKSSCELADDRSEDRSLLERWYILNKKTEPPCYCLKTNGIAVNIQTVIELNRLYNTLVNVFTKELRDSYLTSVIEQEINNTVLISEELSKRCVWVHTGVLPTKNIDTSSGPKSATIEVNRRLNNIQSELRNQLSEKNLMRIPPSVQLSNESLAASLNTLITANIDAIVEDHTNKYHIPYCTYGVDRNLLAEIEAVNQHSKLLNQNCANFEIMDSIKSYITTPSTEPLVIFGRKGSGKSALSAKVAQFVHSWLPDCCLILRYTRLTPLSFEIVSLLGSIAEQILYFTKTEPYTGTHSIQSYTDTIKACIESTKYQVVILIDSLDEALRLKNLDWLPTKLTEQVKIIITTTSTVSRVDECKGANELILWSLKDRISKSNFVHLKQFSNEQWNEVLSYGGGDFYTSNIQLELPYVWKVCADKIPLQAKLFWWLAWLGEINLSNISLDSVCNKIFEIIENRFGKDIIKFIISLIVTSRDGLYETEVIQLLNSSKLCLDSVAQLWLDFCWIMGRGPILLHTNYVKLMDNKLKNIAETRYKDDIKKAHEILYQYYSSQPDITADKNGKYQTHNIRKFIELPYHAYKIDEITNSSSSTSFDKSTYLCDLNWIQSKLKATRCVQYILNDIFLLEKQDFSKSNHLLLLQKFFESNIRPINYDADQFYPLLKHFISTSLTKHAEWSQDPIYQKWLNDFESIPISYLDIINEDGITTKGQNKDIHGYDVITNLGGDGYFVASLCTHREEICVWNVPKCKKVRVLKGIPQPTALCPVDDYGAAVLCRREIRIIDLNKGIFRVTLKGVMNQKMPYFAYCNDAQHLVCLSRNRMYVNLMNLTSGDCITTFKAGEDRFLNSLLVSGDGRILVCGDETQKPFPLLVWHLSQRKLLYDLRIPHHDFLTSLSAITNEGSYVCVVAKELNEPAPNFIVVYDLQSGTLFKKWKPSCNTVSLSISQTNACVVAGLEDARILIWDLVTGNCKYVLIGHTAPVTLLKLDPKGKILLSADKEGRDRSVRLWELSTGKPIAVHTPPKKITTCEILSLGKYIVLGLENQPNLVTLELKNSNTNIDQSGDSDINETEIYGDEENDENVFQL